MIRRPPISTRVRSSAASDVYKRQIWTCNMSRSRHATPSTSSATSPTICNGFESICCQRIPTTRCARSQSPVRNAFEETLSPFRFRKAVDERPKRRAVIRLDEVCEFVHEDVFNDPPGHPLQSVRQPDALFARTARTPAAVLIGHPPHRTWFGRAGKVGVIQRACQREKFVIAVLAALLFAIEAFEQ